jgi:hypothetical protein
VLLLSFDGFSDAPTQDANPLRFTQDRPGGEEFGQKVFGGF